MPAVTETTLRVDALEDKVSTLEEIVYEGKYPGLWSIALLTQNMELNTQRLNYLQQMMQQMQVEDKRSRNQTKYLFVIFIITALIRIFNGSINIDQLKHSIGL